MSEYHVPVLLHACLNALMIDPNGIYVDATFGGGGHSRALLERLGPGGRLIAFDQDADAQTNAIKDDRFVLIHGNFRFINHYLRYHKIFTVHGIMADLGVSSFQIDQPAKGFTFTGHEAFDMRMNQDASVSALDVVNKESEENLLHIFSSYGEVRNSRTLAKVIVETRAVQPFKNANDFLHCVRPLAIGNKARYLAQVFQAIRIKVNDEIGSLEDFMIAGVDLLVSGGRLVILSYHSIEDRLVKHFIKSGKLFGDKENYKFSGHGHNDKWLLKPVNKKPIVADASELQQNRRARSAKLRIAEKL